MSFCLNTKDWSVYIKPKGEWSGDLNQIYYSEISGILDSDYTKDTQTRKCVSRYATFLNGALITAKSKMKKNVWLFQWPKQG